MVETAPHRDRLGNEPQSAIQPECSVVLPAAMAHNSTNNRNNQAIDGPDDALDAPRRSARKCKKTRFMQLKPVKCGVCRKKFMSSYQNDAYEKPFACSIACFEFTPYNE